MATIQLTYDSLGRVATAQLPTGRTVTYGYDANGNTVSVQPPGQPAHVFVYDGDDQRTDYTAPDLGTGAMTTHIAYDAEHKITQVTQPDGTVYQLVYDPFDRLNMIQDPLGTMTYGYDPVTANLQTITTRSGVTTTLAWDGPFPLSTTWSGTLSGSVVRTYDASLRVATKNVDGETPIIWNYDNDSLLTGVGPLVVVPDPQNSWITSVTLGQSSSTRQPDQYGAPLSETDHVGAATVRAVQYQQRDPVGRLQHLVETVTGTTHAFDYTYDVAGRLTDVKRDGAAIGHYDWDANDNRVSANGATATFDAQDRIMKQGPTSFDYDNVGRITTITTNGKTITLTWDVFGLPSTSPTCTR